MKEETATTPAMQRYLPRVALEWELDAPDRPWQAIDATLVFVDISGFTRLSEKLARRGRIGAEVLTEVLSAVFGRMLALAYERGGALLKFGGDALLLIFRSDDHAVQACSAAVEMRAALRAASGLPSAAGRLDLKMSVGIHSGTVHLFLVGDLHRELLVAGPAATLTAAMEKAANQGQIMVSPATADALPRGSTGPRVGPGHLLRWRRARVAPVGAVLPRQVPPDSAVHFLPARLHDALAGAVEPEHRIASVGFMRFEGTDDVLAHGGPDALAADLDEAIRIVQWATDREGVTFLASDLDSNGFKVLLTTGVPDAKDDDEGRLVRAMREVLDVRPRLIPRAGANRGHVFAGEVGTEYRSTYTVMDDTVNLAARLMAAAPPGEMYATAGVLDQARTLFETHALEPFTVKGRTAPVQAYAVQAELGTRPNVVDRGLPFAGRTAERAELLGLLDDARAGRGGLVSIVGEQGIGKTRLADELRAAAADLPILEARGEPYGVGTPYRSLRDTLRVVLGVERGRTEDMAAQLRASVMGIAPSLLPFLPLVGTVVHVDLEDTPETAALEHRFRRARLNEVVVELLGAARPGPTVVIVEDAQWMDEATAELLEQLARLTSELPWLICLTRREQAGGYTMDEGSVIALGPLPDDEARRLLAAASEAAPLRTHEVEAIVERAGGSPLYLEELLTIARGAGGLEGGLPDSLDAVVGAEIDALPPLTRRLLRYASVLGRSFRPEVLREVIAGEVVALDEVTREQLARHLLPDGNERLVFRHGVLRDAAYGGLSYRRRRDLHQRAGEAIERLAQPDPEGVADALALHFGLAQDHERTWRYARVAGDRARSTYANIEAQDHYERALEGAQQLGTVPPPQRIEVWTALGDVREQAGLFDAALAAFRRATRLVGGDVVAAAALLQRCSRVHERRGAYAAALRRLTEAHRLLDGRHDPEADAARARLLSFGATIRAAQGRPELALAQAEVAVDEARRTGEASALAKAYLILDWANTQLGHSDAPTHGGEALEIFEQEGDLASQAAVLTNLGCAEYFAGSWDEALELYERGRAACLRAGNDVQATVAAVNIAEILINQGHLTEAEPLLREAIRVNRASGFLDGVAFSEMYLGRLLLQRGDHHDAASALRASRDQAAALGEKLLALEGSVYLAECLTRQGYAPAALAELEEAEVRAGGSVAVLVATVERVRAVTLAELGRFAEAETAVKAGLEDARRQGLAYETARLLATSTELDRRMGRMPDVDDQREAAELFEGLGVRVERPVTTAG